MDIMLYLCNVIKKQSITNYNLYDYDKASKDTERECK